MSNATDFATANIVVNQDSFTITVEFSPNHLGNINDALEMADPLAYDHMDRYVAYHIDTETCGACTIYKARPPRHQTWILTYTKD